MDITINSEHRLRSENLSFDIDVWYPILSKFTFKSVFLPISIQEREAIIRFNEVSWRDVRINNNLSTDNIKILKQLENDITSMIKSNFPNGAFLRLCGRSPKDGDPLQRKKIWSQYSEIYTSLINNGWSDDIHTKMMAISQVNLLKIENGSEAMSLLLTSERVFSDMIDWKLYGEPEQICLREYCPFITLDLEFRSFIYNKKLTCITQYDHHSFYPHIQSLKDKIINAITNEVKLIQEYIQIKNYVADFIYDKQNEKVILIEISPFLPCTGSSLFSWSEELDILKGKLLPEITFRMKRKEDVHQQLGELMEMNWDDRWRQEEIPYYKWYEKVENTLKVNTDNSSDGSNFLFVYGTLKKGFHWNDKYLNPRVGGCFISKAITVDKFLLVIGQCGVLYVVNPKEKNGEIGKKIKGEVWKVTNTCLKGLDEYEGISKGYYLRESIQIELESGKKLDGFIYLLNEIDNINNIDNALDEYSLDFHKKWYSPINHIQVKQLRYYKNPSTWGKIGFERVSEIDISNTEN